MQPLSFINPDPAPTRYAGTSAAAARRRRSRRASPATAGTRARRCFPGPRPRSAALCCRTLVLLRSSRSNLLDRCVGAHGAGRTYILGRWIAQAEPPGDVRVGVGHADDRRAATRHQVEHAWAMPGPRRVTMDDQTDR